MELINTLVSQYLKLRKHKTNKMRYHAVQSQAQILKKIIKHGKGCSYGYDHYIQEVETASDFRQAIPVNQYTDLAPFIKRMMKGEKKLLCASPVKWFAKSSGTTDDRSKYIPVTNDYLFKNHIKGNWDMVTFIYDQTKDAQIFHRKNLLMGGSYKPWKGNPNVFVGDITGIMVQNIPPVGRPYYTPDFETAMIEDWDTKIEKISEICAYQDVTLAAGVPTWSLILFEKMIQNTGKAHMQEVWPNAIAYVHGGVNFEPYRKQFEAYFPEPGFQFLQGYNASEGYLALQDVYGRDDMLLLVDNENYFEFIPLVAYQNGLRKSISLADVETDINYVLLMSNTSGMWRYVIGDTVKFTSINPFRIKVTGRTTQFLNVFGEELIVDNVEMALAKVCKEYKVLVSDYTVAPKFMRVDSKGRHDWLIEFIVTPNDVQAFARAIDDELQKLNSDYAAKRKANVALECLQITSLPKGSFENWYRSKGKFGSQNKVPRLSNNRNIISELLSLRDS